MPLPIRVVAVPDGSSPRDLTAAASAVKWATAAVGGFADASFTLDGFVRLPYLSLVRVFYGAALAWEGQIEDIRFQIANGQKTTEVQAFGLQRLLSRTSVRRVWSRRNISWVEYPGGFDTIIVSPFRKGDATISIGSFDPSDATKIGVRAAGNATALAQHYGNYAGHTAESGVTYMQLLGTITLTGGNTGNNMFAGAVLSAVNGSWTQDAIPVTSSTFAYSLPAGTNFVVLGGQADQAVTPTSSDTIDYTNLRLLGTSLSEDASGGFYGGTILRDLVALVPGLTSGVIDDGSDYTIQAIERSVRTAVSDAVSEVAAYYPREWSVWEDGRFDWTTRNLDETQNIVTLAQLDSLDIDGSVAGSAAVAYVLYTDAASQMSAEASAASTSQRNPFVKQGKTMDLLSQPGFPMTSTTAAQLAARVVADQGQWPAASGQITLPAAALVTNAAGAAKPAALIRGGENLLIADMPRDDIFGQGRDGQTLFHIVSTETDLDAGTVTLTLEAQLAASDVTIARLAAVTRTITG